METQPRALRRILSDLEEDTKEEDNSEEDKADYMEAKNNTIINMTDTKLMKDDDCMGV